MEAAKDDDNATIECASPPCFMREVDPVYLGLPSRQTSTSQPAKQEEMTAHAKPSKES